MKPTVASATPIPGWDCTLIVDGDEGKIYQCSPSDEYIAVAAYFIWRNNPDQPADLCWVAGEDQLIMNWDKNSGNRWIPSTARSGSVRKQSRWNAW